MTSSNMLQSRQDLMSSLILSALSAVPTVHICQNRVINSRPFILSLWANLPFSVSFYEACTSTPGHQKAVTLLGCLLECFHIAFATRLMLKPLGVPQDLSCRCLFTLWALTMTPHFVSWR